jgi:hypothetical protein
MFVTAKKIKIISIALHHSWAPLVKKNIDWIDTDNRLLAKNID